jgi:hypothetical protein
LFLIEWLIRDDGEPEFVRIKIQRPVLIRDWDADEFDLFNHGKPTLRRPLLERPAPLAFRTQKPLSVYRYSTRFAGAPARTSEHAQMNMELALGGAAPASKMPDRNIYV